MTHIPGKANSLGRVVANMTRLFCILVLASAYVCADVGGGYAQVSEVPDGWKKISVCQFHFLIPQSMKNQNARGIDSCVAEFKSSKMRLAIDYGAYSGSYMSDGSNLDFKEEVAEIDGKKAQLVTFKDARERRDFVAGLYVLIHEETGRKISLNMTITVRSAEDLETAKRVFRSIRFDKYKPFIVEW
jgi:hypothetical protein